MAIKLGYDGVALNRTLTGRTLPSDIGKMKEIDLQQGPAQYVAHLRMRAEDRQFKQISRLTFHLEDPSQVHSLHNSNQILANYDLIAVRPSTETLLRQSADSLEIDIISLDLSGRLPFALRIKLITVALQRGIMFEICYSAALRDVSARRYLMKNATDLVRVTKGKNIIISSDARNALEFRGPYDVMNLSCLFGMDLALSKQTLSTNCRAAILHGEARKTGKAVFAIQPLQNLDALEEWKVPAYHKKEEPTEKPTEKSKRRKNKRKRQSSSTVPT